MKYRCTSVCVFTAACLAMVACEHRSPAQSRIGPTPVGEPLFTRLTIEIPSIVHLGAAPITPVVRAQFADGSTGDLPASLCLPEWSSSSPEVAAANGGLIEIRSVGDVTIRADCGSKLRGEAALGVRRRVVGVVLERYGNVPTANAEVRVVGTPAAGTSALSDQSGRFVLSVMEAELEIEAIASGLEVQRQRINVGAGDVVFRLDPASLTTEWSGTFQRFLPPRLGQEAIGIPPGGRFEFETHRAGSISLSIMAGCQTMGTYDDFGAVVLKSPEDRLPSVVGVWAGERFQSYTESVFASPGKYLLTVASGNFYATVGCPWSLILKRPH